MRKRETTACVLLLAVALSNACIDADHRTLREGQAGAGSSSAGADSGGTAGAAHGGTVAGSTAGSGAAPEAGAGGEPTAGSPSTIGGASAAGENAGGVAGGGAGGGAGAGTGPEDEGILSEWALWSVPNSPDHNWPNLFNYDADDADVTIDQITGLTWQKHAASSAVTWQAANDACEALALGGYDDWRLPVRMELISIVDYDKSDPATDSTAFPATKLDYYWTSTVAVGAPTRHWQVDFASGSVFFEDSAKNTTPVACEGKPRCRPRTTRPPLVW